MNERTDGGGPEGDFTASWVANTMVEAQLAEAALCRAGVRYLVENFQANPYDGAFAMQFGWGRILVRPQDADRARELITEALAPTPACDEEEKPENY